MDHLHRSLHDSRRLAREGHSGVEVRLSLVAAESERLCNKFADGDVFLPSAARKARNSARPRAIKEFSASVNRVA
jgi:hypothetical protein